MQKTAYEMRISDWSSDVCSSYLMRDISSVTCLSVVDALAFFQALPADLTAQQNEIAERILKEILERLGFLNNVGLDYLNLDRTSGTLSGGESQRIRLASQLDRKSVG